MRLALALIAAAVAAPAVAQTPAAPVTQASAAVDPARLAVASRIMEQVMPAAERGTLAEKMIAPMMSNVADGMLASPQFAQVRNGNPGFEPAMRRFLAGEQKRTIELMTASLPALSDSMARAYARRFDLKQLTDIEAFFNTPSGRAYVRESMTIMSDPDIAAAQRDMMMRSMTGIQERVGAFVADLQKQGSAQ